MYCKGLSKQELVDYGFISVIYKNKEWVIFRNWFRNNSQEKELKTIKITEATRKHKYRPDKVYPKVNFSVRGKGIFSIPLSRFIYVWFNGDVPDGYVVDHIDNDPYNNHPDNLQILTISENLEKRYEDDPEAWTNQWGRTKDWQN